MISKVTIKSTRVQHFWNRQGFVRYIFVLLLLGFAYRIVSIHNLSAGDISLQQRAINQSSLIVTDKARRGDILDRNGEILASNLMLKRIVLNPLKIQSEFITRLADSIGMPFGELETILAEKRKNNRGYLVIKKNIAITNPIIGKVEELIKTRIKVCREKNTEKKLSLVDKALSILGIKKYKTEYETVSDCSPEIAEGIAIENDTKRYYPKGASLAPLIGRMNHDNEGISGIEGEFDKVLAGQNGKRQLEYTNTSNQSYFNSKSLSDLEHGQNITLTIDSEIQFHAFKALENSVAFHEAESGSAIVLSANGEVLAMANYPADDPNNKAVYNPQHYRNRVLADKVEPGSTMKPFTMLLALDKNRITATDDELIDVTKRIGHIRPDKKYKQMTIKKILEKSHNLGTVNISERLTKEEMYSAWSALGFGYPLGLIPSIENSGSLRHYSSWGDVDKRALSFGHGPMETNLAQLARAYLVFANDGKIPSLKLIDGVNYDKKYINVFSSNSVDKISTILDSVVSDKGSGYRAQIDGYSVAGKTGTAERVINGVYSKKGEKRTFFVGFAPAKKPKYIMAVRLDYPKKCFTSWNPELRNRCEGSNSASMTFKETMEDILTNDSSIKLLSDS